LKIFHKFESNILIILFKYLHSSLLLKNDRKYCSSISIDDSCGVSFIICNNSDDDSILQVDEIARCFRLDKLTISFKKSMCSVLKTSTSILSKYVAFSNDKDVAFGK
jgi:hypothetical protein